MQDLAEQAELYRRTRKVADEKNYTASVVYRIEKLTEYAQQRAAGQEKEAGLAKK